MIKITLFNYNKFYNFLPQLKKNKQLSVVSKPIFSYMFLSPNFDRGNIFNKSLFDSFDFINDTIKKVDSVSIKKTETIREEKKETIRKEKVEEKPKIIPIVSNITVDIPEKQEKINNFISVIKDSFVKTAQILAYPVATLIDYTAEKYDEVKYKRKRKREKRAQAQQILETSIHKYQTLCNILNIQTKTPKIKSKKLSLKSIESMQKDINEKILQQSIAIDKLQETRKIYDQRLREYKALFYGDEMLPDFSCFENYNNLSLQPLQVLLADLNLEIERQNNIVNIKRAITEGAYGYNSGPAGSGSTKCYLNRISLIDYKNKSQRKYISNLNKLCESFFINSKILDNSISGFNIIVKNFFAKSSIKLKEIFNLQNDKKIKWLERIPKLGIIPKGLRVYEQNSLANCIVKDFKEITKNQVENEMHVAIREFQWQYRTIADYINRHKDKFDNDTNKYSKIMLNKLESCKEKRMKTYGSIFDIFSSGGCNVKNICNQIKTKGIISLTQKAIITFGTLF